MRYLICVLVVMGLCCQWALANDEEQIGLILPLSGSRASIGQDARNGAELASSELNDEWLETEKKLQTMKRLVSMSL